MGPLFCLQLLLCVALPFYCTTHPLPHLPRTPPTVWDRTFPLPVCACLTTPTCPSITPPRYASSQTFIYSYILVPYTYIPFPSPFPTHLPSLCHLPTPPPCPFPFLPWDGPLAIPCNTLCLPYYLPANSYMYLYRDCMWVNYLPPAITPAYILLYFCSACI